MTASQPDLSRLRINRDALEPRRRGLALPIGLGLVVVAAGVGIWQWKRPRPVPVTVALAEVVGGGGPAAVGITANGYVIARTKASVASKVTGRLEYLGVAEGSRVRKGEIIARIENQEARASVDRSAADVATAKAQLAETIAQRDQLERDLARARSLHEKNLGTLAQVEDLTAQLAQASARVDTRRAQVAAAEAALAVASAALENTLIRAPFSGTVLRKDAEVGEVVAPVATGTGLTRGAVVTMADLETLEVEVDVNEAYIGQLARGQQSAIVLDAYPDQRFKGAVRQIVPTADRQKATVQVKVAILERDPRILPEMGARVEFLEAAKPTGGPDVRQRVLVPADAVRTEGGGTVVWIVTGGAASKRSVVAGPVSGGKREIRSGLSGGEQVVLGAESLKDGQAVTVAAPK